jgi:hypothetical protein
MPIALTSFLINYSITYLSSQKFKQDIVIDEVGYIIQQYHQAIKKDEENIQNLFKIPLNLEKKEVSWMKSWYNAIIKIPHSFFSHEDVESKESEDIKIQRNISKNKLNSETKKMKNYNFFKCSGLELVQENFGPQKKLPYLSKCLEEALKRDFKWPSKSMKDIIKKIDQTNVATILAIAVRLLLKIEEQNYSPYFLKKAIQTGEIMKTAKGKMDDISVVVGLVVSEPPKNSLLEKMNDALRKNKKILYEKLETNIKYFLTNPREVMKKRPRSLGKLGILI